VPLRIGLALSTTPWIQDNIVDVFLTDKKDVAAIDDGDDNISNKEEEETARSRFRILNRIGNLINHILRRGSDEKDVVKEEEDNSTEEEEETATKEILTNNRWWNQSVMTATTTTTTTTTTDIDNHDEDNISNKEEEEDTNPRGRFGNLIDRILRRNNLSQQTEKE
jgi:hypothetical protein